MHPYDYDRIVLEPERRQLTGVSKTSWWRLEKAGEVPKRLTISDNRVGWSFRELQAWVRDRIAERDAGLKPRAEAQSEAA